VLQIGGAMTNRCPLSKQKKIAFTGIMFLVTISMVFSTIELALRYCEKLLIDPEKLNLASKNSYGIGSYR
jgi:hypothetical protein